MLSRNIASGRLFLIAVLVCFAVPASTYASTLQISFTGLGLLYDGSTIYDAGGNNPIRPGGPSQADALSSMSFYVDGSPVGFFSAADNIYADIRIPGVFNIPLPGGMVMSTGPFPGFGFDLFIGSTVLALNTDSPFLIIWDGQVMSVLGSASTSSIQGQALPFGLTIGTPVSISFSTLAFDYLTTEGGMVSRFAASGTGEARAPIAPLAPPTCAFADSVVSFTPGPGTLHTSAANMLDAPDGEAVPLGTDGSVVLRLSSWVGDEPGIDFYIDENGAAVGAVDENFRVEVSQDGFSFWQVGEGAGGSVGFDLDGSGYDRALYVRITDVPPLEPQAEVPNLGADIDAIRVMHCASAPPIATEPTTWSRIKQQFVK